MGFLMNFINLGVTRGDNKKIFLFHSIVIFSWIIQ